MAKAAGQRVALVKWFSAQGFESQEKMLDELSGIFERGKAGKIKSLEAELARLRGAAVAAAKASARSSVKAAVKRGSAAKSGSPLSGRKIPPKYRHPKNKALTWAGRGVHPTWVAEFLKGGGKLDSLLIKK